MKSLLTSVLLACATAPVVAAPPAAGEHLSFVACPIVRDTKSVPCWLAEYDGELYFLTLQTDVSAPVTPPWLGHQVLVEGEVSDAPGICGGRILKPLSLSVMPELDGACNTILPAEDRFNLTFEPPRPPGPSRGRLAFGDPTAAGGGAAVVGAAEAGAPTVITLQYEFDGMVAFRHAQLLQQILDAARTTHAREVRITAYRSASRLSDGRLMREREQIGRARAEQIRELLEGAGLEGVTFTLQWQDLSKRSRGAAGAANRRAEVVVVAGS
jgi:hypothetical protein